MSTAAATSGTARWSMKVVDRTSVETLAPEARDVAFDLASRSNHPASRCLTSALGRLGARFSPAARVTELPGQGVEMVRDGVVVAGALGVGRGA
ncbi:hypothetical protein ACLESO_33635 [Pyxidicoccus sp. 3LG]